MSSLPDKPIPTLSQDTTQPKVVPQISLLEMSETQDKLINTTHASFTEIAKCKAVNREGIWDIVSKGIPPYISAIYRPSQLYAEPTYRPPPKPLPRPPDIPKIPNTTGFGHGLRHQLFTHERLF